MLGIFKHCTVLFQAWKLWRRNWRGRWPWLCCLAALFLVLTSAKRAVVIDPAEVGQNGVDRAWSEFYNGKQLVYRHECLRTGLRDELLDQILSKMKVLPNRILVVACHACQHLSDEMLEIACDYGVHAAVMPCCQKYLDGSWKAAAKRLGINFASLMDILMAGKVMSWNSGKEAGVCYQVRMMAIDEKITPQNRIILWKALSGDKSALSMANQAKLEAHVKLKRAYEKAHSRPKRRKTFNFSRQDFCFNSAVIGLVAGIVLSNLTLFRHKRWWNPIVLFQ